MYTKPVNQYGEFVNTSVANKVHCSVFLAYKQAMLLVDDAWKAASYGIEKNYRIGSFPDVLKCEQ